MPTLLLVLLLLIGCTAVGGETTVSPEVYYLALTGSDTNDGKSKDSAIRTFSQAASLLSAGDQLFIVGGSYSEPLHIQATGTSQHPIIIRAYPGERVIIDGSQHDDNTVRLEGQWLVLQDITVQNSAQRGVLVARSRYVTLRNITARDNGHVGIQFYRSRDSLLEGCESHGNFDEATQGNDADGVQVLSSRFVTVRHCLMYDNSDDGFDAWDSSDIVVEYSVSHNNGYKRGDGNGFKLSNRSDGRTIIRNSVAYSNKLRGIDGNSGGGHVVVNNTTFDNGWTGFADFGNNYSIKNNLSYEETRPPIRNGLNNSWDLDLQSPRFRSTNPNDANFLSLDTGSPGLGRALRTTALPRHYARDLGALEYGMTISALLQVGAP